MIEPPARPWLSAYADGVPHVVDVPDGPLTELLTDAAKRFGSRVALDFLGATTTYRALEDQVLRAAQGLRLLGVGQGDRVAVVPSSSSTTR